jgi:hypothetical protein
MKANPLFPASGPAQRLFQRPLAKSKFLAAETESFPMKSPWADEADQPAVTLTAGKTHTFQLEPFQVIVLARTQQN